MHAISRARVDRSVSSRIVQLGRVTAALALLIGAGCSGGDASGADAPLDPDSGTNPDPPPSATPPDPVDDGPDPVDDGPDPVDDAPACLGEALPLDTGWVDRASNGCGFQGPWYWFSDTAGTTVAGVASMEAPLRAGQGVCLAGQTVEDSTFEAWGAGIALGLNQEGTDPAQPTSLAALGIEAFDVTITGSATQELRFVFSSNPDSTLPAPFVVLPGAGTHHVRIADAIVPVEWTDQPNAGAVVDPAAVAALQLVVAGGALAAPFDVCISALVPVGSSDPGTGTDQECSIAYPPDGTITLHGLDDTVTATFSGGRLTTLDFGPCTLASWNTAHRNGCEHVYDCGACDDISVSFSTTAERFELAGCPMTSTGFGPNGEVGAIVRHIYTVENPNACSDCISTCSEFGLPDCCGSDEGCACYAECSL